MRYETIKETNKVSIFLKGKRDVFKHLFSLLNKKARLVNGGLLYYAVKRIKSYLRCGLQKLLGLHR